jgi:hypothetical protein
MDDGKWDYPRVEEDNLRDVTHLFTFNPDRTMKLVYEIGKDWEKVGKSPGKTHRV